MVGEPDETASVSTLFELRLLSRNQLLLGTVSPNIRAPIVRELSSSTVLSAVRLSVLKSATPSMPLATIPLCQLPVPDQSLAPVVAIQVPLCPCVTQTVGPSSRIPAATAARHMMRAPMAVSHEIMGHR